MLLGIFFISNIDIIYQSALAFVHTDSVKLIKQLDYMGLVARKPVFGVSGNANFKSVSSATETS